MKKFLPFAPLFTLMIGLIFVQANNAPQGLLSSIISPSENEIISVCSKPAKFTKPEESAWCHTGLVKNIQEHQSSWNWSCLKDEKTYPCYFTETKHYPVRGALFFDK